MKWFRNSLSLSYLEMVSARDVMQCEETENEVLPVPSIGCDVEELGVYVFIFYAEIFDASWISG